MTLRPGPGAAPGHWLAPGQDLHVRVTVRNSESAGFKFARPRLSGASGPRDSEPECAAAARRDTGKIQVRVTVSLRLALSSTPVPPYSGWQAVRACAHGDCDWQVSRMMAAAVGGTFFDPGSPESSAASDDRRGGFRLGVKI